MTAIMLPITTHGESHMRASAFQLTELNIDPRAKMHKPITANTGDAQGQLPLMAAASFENAWAMPAMKLMPRASGINGRFLPNDQARMTRTLLEVVSYRRVAMPQYSNTMLIKPAMRSVA